MKMKRLYRNLLILGVLAFGIGVFGVPILHAVTALYNSTVRIVDSSGNVIGGTASAVSANYNSTVRVVDSTGHVIDSFGGGGGAFVTPETYSAKGDGKIAYDGSVITTATSTNNGTGTTITATSVTTTVANSYVVTAMGFQGASFSPPGVPTSRANIANGATNYGYYFGDQNIASPGASGNVTGTQLTDPWVAINLVLAPSGGTITEIATANANATSGVQQSLIVNKPTGTALGQLMVACIIYPQTGTQTAPSGWTQIATVSYQTNFTEWCGSKVAGASEPSTYTWSYNVNCFSSASITTYSNAVVASATANVLNSAGAAFVSGDVGKLICVNGVGSAGVELCGTITAVNSATSVTISFSGTTTASGQEYRYGTDNCTPFTNAIAAMSNGGTLLLSSGAYASSCSLAFTPNVGQILQGVSSTVSNNENFTTVNGTATGSAIWFLTKSLSAAGVQFIGVNGSASANALSGVRNVTLYAGAGRNFDGGGADGLDVVNWQGFEADQVHVFNFAHAGIYIDGHTNTNTDYAENVRIHDSFIEWSGTAGIVVGGNGTYVETTELDNSTIENNQTAGVKVAGHLQGLTVFNNTIQWNNIASAAPEITVTGTVESGSCVITGNYIEGGFKGGQSTTAITNAAGLVGCSFVGNYYSNVPNFQLVFSVAGTALPSCTNSNAASGLANTQNLYACVSDATTCVNGTGYVGSGSTPCMEKCVSTTWTDLGAGC